MNKKLGQDFADLQKSIGEEFPDVDEYLKSYSVVIGDLVLARRIQMGLTQKELANLAGTIQPTISRIEAGDDGIKSGTLNKVFKALKLQTIEPHFREEAAALVLNF